IYENKSQNDRPHFTTRHGKLGLAVTILAVVQSLAGLYANSLPTAFTLRRAHRIAGVSLLLGLLAVSALGLYTGWIARDAEKYPLGWEWVPAVGLAGVAVGLVSNAGALRGGKW
ncbi:hypothetical protein BDK51DRAFT_45908, partial [Blyttiomyces helicus]